MKSKMTFSEIINPKTRLQAETVVKQVFWFLVLIVLLLAAKAIPLILVFFQTGIDEIGQIPGTNFSSLSEIISAFAVDVIILIVAMVFFRWKKSLVAAVVILVLAGWRLVNVIMAYFVYEIASLEIMTVVTSVVYIAAAIVGVLAIYKWKKLT